MWKKNKRSDGRITTLMVVSLITLMATRSMFAQPTSPEEVLIASTAESVRFAAIGDFGNGSSESVAVATLVGGWQPDFIVTVGDNNYPDGDASTIDDHIGKLYHNYIYPFHGSIVTPTPNSTPGPATNRFWPTLGNHDWHTLVINNGNVTGAYFDYFTLPGNERYYEVVNGPVHFFMVDSDSVEPDGITETSVQGQWLKERLTTSTVPWKLVLFHHAAYSSSSNHGSNRNLQWPFATWGADAVLSGHDHTYERLKVNGLTYFVNGLGGASPYAFGTPVAGSLKRYNAENGAMLIEANATTIRFRMINISGKTVDQVILNKSLATPTVTPSSQTVPTATSTNTLPLSPTVTKTSTATPKPTLTKIHTATPKPTTTKTPVPSTHLNFLPIIVR